MHDIHAINDIHAIHDIHEIHATSRIVNGESLISAPERAKRYNQTGATIWITGLHGSGKNEVAYSLERQLFDRGNVTVLLDGKSVRSGLSRELDFSPADRAEHLPGIDSEYQEPAAPAIVIEAAASGDKTEQIVRFLEEKKIMLYSF
ncbi:MAG: adenylyl-sulfate kinase [Bacteroidales bacterium]|nr:adenylyl-sulfate kinase [Bacteroidales bacterium]